MLTRDPGAIEAYAEELSQAIGSDTVQVQPWWEASPQTSQMMGMRDFSALLILGIVFGAAAFGVLNTMMMSVFERTRELGVLRALGIRPGRLVWLILIESFFLAGLSAVIGLMIGGVLDWYIVVHGLDFSSAGEDGFSFSGIVLDPIIYGVVRPISIAYIVVAVFVVSVLSSLWPALRAARLRPVEAIRSE